MSRSRAQGKRNWRFDLDLDPSPMYRIEIEPYIEEARSSLREAYEAYKKEKNKYDRLCQKGSKKDRIKREKIKLDEKRNALEKARKHFEYRSSSYPFITKK